MSLLKVNEVQNYNGSSLTLTASTVSTSAQLNTGGNISVTGSINVSDDSTTRSNLGLGSVATQDANAIALTGGSLTGTEIDLKSSGTSIFKSDGTTAVLSESAGTATLENTRVWRTDIVHLSGWYNGSSFQSPYYAGEMDRIYPFAILNATGEKAFFHWYIPDDCSEINTIDIIWYQSGNPGANQGELNFTTRVVINQGYTTGTNTSATVNLGASTNGQLRKTSVAGSTLLPTQTSGNYVIFEAEFDFSAGSAGSYFWGVGSLVINWR